MERAQGTAAAGKRQNKARRAWSLFFFVHKTFENK
jgi:hypothetical protein